MVYVTSNKRLGWSFLRNPCGMRIILPPIILPHSFLCLLEIRDQSLAGAVGDGFAAVCYDGGHIVCRGLDREIGELRQAQKSRYTMCSGYG